VPSLGVHTVCWFGSDYGNTVCLGYGILPCQKKHFYRLLGFFIYYLGIFYS